MPLHVENRGGVARSEICRCRGNHVGGVESEHESLRHLAVYERSYLRDNLLYKLLLRPAVGLSLAPYRQHEVASEKCRIFRKRLRPAIPLHVDELVRKVLVWAFLVGVSAYRRLLVAEVCTLTLPSSKAARVTSGLRSAIEVIASRVLRLLLH